MAKQLWGYTFRRFKGKRYRIGTWHSSKTDAQKAAMRLRNKGYQVRIVRKSGQYVIYAYPDPFKQ